MGVDVYLTKAELVTMQNLLNLPFHKSAYATNWRLLKSKIDLALLDAREPQAFSDAESFKPDRY